MLTTASRAALVLSILTSVTLSAEQGWKFWQRGNKNFKPFTTLELLIDYPERDWQHVRGVGTVLVTFSTRRGAVAVGIERSKFGQPLKAADITDLFAELELDVIKENHPDATAINSTLVVHPTLGRIVRAEYSRGQNDTAERVRQYSIPTGWYLYRVVCSAPSADFVKYEPTFEHMVGSVRLTPPQPKEGP